MNFLDEYEKRTRPHILPREEENLSTITAQQQDPSTFPPDIQRIKETILETTSSLLYISETEEPYEFIFIPNKELTELPNDCTQFKTLIKQSSNLMIKEEESSSPEANRTLEFQEFFDNFTADYAEDPYGQKDGYKELQKIIEATFHGKENVKIYKIGDYRRIGVYIVGLIKGSGIVGLKTFSVET